MALINQMNTRQDEPGSDFEIKVSPPKDIAYMPSPQLVFATVIGIDQQNQELNFRGEVKLRRIAENNMFEFADLDLMVEIPRIRFSYDQKDRESTQLEIKRGDFLVTADYPYSQLLTDSAPFKKHNSDISRFQRQLAEEIKKKSPCSDEDIASVVLSYLDARPYDGWETQHQRLTASFLPMPRRSESHERTRQVTVKHTTVKPDTLEPGWVFGVVRNYEECYWHLYASLTPLVDLAELGKLHLNDHRVQKSGKPYKQLEIPDALKGMTDTITKMSIKQALAGPPNYEKWVNEHGQSVENYAQYLFRQHFSRMELRYFRATTKSYTK